MSHKATNWAVQQRGIRPAAKVLLWHLADRHHPDHGCFPSQDTLARDTEVSRSGLNVLMRELEKAGLIRREKRLDPDTHRQKSTRYFLAFEDGFDEKPCAENGHGTESKSGAEPSPENGESRVQILDTNPVMEPVREPPQTPTAAPAEPAEPDVAVTLRSLRAIWPVDRARAPKRAEKALREAVAAGVSQSTILAEARTYIEAEKDRERFRFVKPLHAWIDALPGAHVPSPPVSAEAADGVLRMFAERINQGAFVSPSALTSAKARRIVELGLVPEATMHQQGFL